MIFIDVDTKQFDDGFASVQAMIDGLLQSAAEAKDKNDKPADNGDKPYARR